MRSSVPRNVTIKPPKKPISLESHQLCKYFIWFRTVSCGQNRPLGINKVLTLTASRELIGFFENHRNRLGSRRAFGLSDYFVEIPRFHKILSQNVNFGPLRVLMTLDIMYSEIFVSQSRWYVAWSNKPVHRTLLFRNPFSGSKVLTGAFCSRKYSSILALCSTCVVLSRLLHGSTYVATHSYR